MTDNSDLSDTTPNKTLLELSTDIVAAYVTKNPVTPTDLPRLIGEVHTALRDVRAATGTGAAAAQEPAVPINKSVKRDRIVCLECGKKYKSLTRHLRTAHELAPAQYREKWNLPADYAMVAQDYSAKRSSLAKQIGLGRKS